jgi:hypothetical protein
MNWRNFRKEKKSRHPERPRPHGTPWLRWSPRSRTPSRDLAPRGRATCAPPLVPAHRIDPKPPFSLPNLPLLRTLPFPSLPTRSPARPPPLSARPRGELTGGVGDEVVPDPPDPLLLLRLALPSQVTPPAPLLVSSQVWGMEESPISQFVCGVTLRCFCRARRLRAAFSGLIVARNPRIRDGCPFYCCSRQLWLIFMRSLTLCGMM